MLKGKRSVSACSLSSCRIRAEALARAFNNRIWPCVWVSQRSSAERDDGMSNGIDDEEEFFDASPSPVEVEDESLFCQQHSSAATEAGRAKLYELLQQHATDDAIDVFYDVSEDANLTDTASNTCLNDDKKKSGEICEPSKCCEQLDDESYFSNNSDSNGKETELTFSNNNNHASDYAMKTEKLDSDDPVEPQLNGDDIQNVSDPSVHYNSINDNSQDSVIASDSKIDEESSETDTKIEQAILEEIENVILCKENSLGSENEVSEENLLDNVGNEDAKNIDVPSLNLNCIMPITQQEESSSSFIEHHSETESQIDGETVKKEDENETIVEVKVEIDSPSSSSDSSEVKTTSPTSRLQIFEEARPKISRTTSLKTGKTPPGTPSRKKIVRFADVLGLDLEDVRHIMSGDLPNIPSSAYTDLNLKDVDFSACEPISEKVEINRRDSSSWQTVQGATAPNALYPLFTIPGEQLDFLDRVRYQGICLETLVVSEMNVQCTCRVMNYGYHKKVIARYTVNDWQSSNDIDASYVTNSSNGETDIFAFSIFLSPLNKNVKFALKYVVNNQEYWDNNRNQDYCLSYHGIDHMHHHLPSPLWQHQFW